MLSTLNIALQPRLSMLNIALCSLRLIMPYSHASTLNIALCYPRCYCLVLSMLNIALHTRCPQWIFPYADNAQCYPRSILPCALQALILPYRHYPHSILPYAVHSLMQSTLIITLCCPRSMLFTLNIALQLRCTRSIGSTLCYCLYLV